MSLKFIHRKIVLIFPLLLLLSLSQQAQTIQTSLSNHILCPNDSVTVPLQVTNFNNISSISLTVLYDSLFVEYLGYQNVNTALSSGFFLVNDVGTMLKIAWFSINPVNIGNGQLLSFRFRYLTGFGALTWDTITPGACQYGDATGITAPSTFTDGWLVANGVIIQEPSPDTIMAGDTAHFSVQAFGTTLAYKWQEITGSAWLNVFNGTFYAGANSPQLLVKGPPQSFNGYAYRCRTTGTCPTPNEYFYSDGAILTVTPPCITATVNAGPDDTICAGLTIALQATANNAQGLLWTGGDGTFSQNGILNPDYIPGPGDIAAGGVWLKLMAASQAPCADVIDSLRLTIAPCPVNQSPVFMQGGQAVNQYIFSAIYGNSLPFCMDMQDPEGDPVFLSTLLQAPLHGTLSGLYDGDTCAFYLPDALFLGQDQFIIEGCDSAGNCDTASVVILVGLPPYNLSPSIMQGGNATEVIVRNIQMNLSNELCFSAFDPEGQDVDITAVIGLPLHATVSDIGNGDTCITIIPDTSYSGWDTLTLLLCDTAGACDTFLLVDGDKL